MPLKILFADDERSLQELMRCEIPGMGHTVAVCPDGTTAIAALQNDSFDCLLVDLDMPGATGLEVIEEAKERCPDAESIILTGKGTLPTAITALRQGVFDYLTKPCTLAEIERVLRRVEEKRELTRKYLAVKSRLQRIEGTRELIGSSPPMQEVQRLIDRIAPTDSTVVILGETGTGKELLARAIHDRSARSEKPFVAVNCGALPENLIESELFGHRKGSFTGADEHRIGLLQVADGGTLFLDEIGELPKGVQAKLLRFLECGEVRKIGENTSIVCNVRVVCATLRNLESMVHSGEFREDLWFRINTFEIAIPPLRERLDDLPDLILHLAKRYQGKTNIREGEKLFTQEAFALLNEYSWPGNVRQLANTIEHALILTDRIPIGVESLPQQIRSGNSRPVVSHREKILEQRPQRPISKSRAAESGPIAELLAFDPDIAQGKTLRDMEMDAIQSSLERNDGNKAKAADELGISLKTLYNKLNQTFDGKKTG
ncbi:MAG: sigma-54 dependent transcriptional regulator [Planctomycetaceae bacterium]|nr:sigma-54 dependent transcriptional regulator [Planctomycetaceae bacterium]